MFRTIVEERAKNVAVMDVFSKLIQERIIFIDEEITPELANGVIAQMLILDSIDNTPIRIYINSPGGSIYDGFAIYDVAHLLKSPIETVCIGLAASMAAVLMLMGSKRSMTKHSRFMFHQPSQTMWGKADEIAIDNEQLQILKKEFFDIVEERTLLTNVNELFRLDTWYNAQQALEANIVTNVL